MPRISLRTPASLEKSSQFQPAWDDAGAVSLGWGNYRPVERRAMRGAGGGVQGVQSHLPAGPFQSQLHQAHRFMGPGR